MKARLFVSLMFTLVLLAAAVQPVLADGIVIPSPCPSGVDCVPPAPICREPPCPTLVGPRPISQLNIRYHRVDVRIENQVAVTHVDQVFANPNDWAVEGTYIFPLPADAVVNQFRLWIDGKAVDGKVLNAQQARRTYEEIVRSLRDPALLEYVGRGAVQASIFPIPPKGERRIELEYSQALTAENGLVRYTYPLNTEKFSRQPLEEVRVRVEVSESQPLRAVYSPSHTVDINRDGRNRAVITYEAASITPNSDFSLVYSLGESEAFHLLSFRDPTDPTDPDGFFLLLLAPRPGDADAAVAKDVLVVLDRSGSMEGEKFTQARSALRYILQHLNSEDRFYVETFSSGLQSFAGELRPASETALALAWADHLSAAGSTDINRALLEAASVVRPGRPTYLIFLTDGLPTEGEVNSERILANFAANTPENLRLFPFGLGYDVDTYLLDSLAQAHHGLSSYVKPDEALDEILSGFYARISTPVMTDLNLDFGDLAVYDVYPDPLPDLFAGSQVVVVGRYRQGGAPTVRLSGQVNGRAQEFKFPEQIFVKDSQGQDGPSAALPRLWTTRKIGYLLNRIRLQGADQETVDQIVRLSIRFGIVTPYTSYLVTEPMPLGAANQNDLSQKAFEQYQAMPTQASGQAAVQRAADQGAMSQADAAAPPSAESADRVRTAGSHTFVLTGEVWTDTLYDPDKMKPVPVPFLSNTYFELASRRPDLSAALALGERVIVVVDGAAYEIVAADASAQAVTLPTPVITATPQPGGATPVPATPQGTATTPVKALPCAGGLIPVLLAVALLLRRR